MRAPADEITGRKNSSDLLLGNPITLRRAEEPRDVSSPSPWHHKPRFLRCKPRETATQRTSIFLHIWFLLCGSVISGKRGLNDCSCIHVMERKSPAHPQIHLHVKEIKEDSTASIWVCMGLVCNMYSTPA